MARLSRSIPRTSSLCFLALVAAACSERAPASEPSPPTGVPALAPSDRAHAPADPGLAAIDAHPIEGWYGIYMMGNKVGHGRMWMKRADDGGYVSGFAMQMSVSGGGNANTIALGEERRYAAAPPHALVETRFSTTAMGFADERRGVPTADGKMRIVRTIAGKPEPDREVPGTKEDLVGQLRVTPLTLDEGDIGKTHEASLWSWDREADEAVSITMRAIESRMRAGVRERVAHIDMTYPATGVKGAVLVAEDGTLLEMSLGASLLMKLEERSVAESGVAGLDIMGTAVRSPARLGSPDEVAVLELEVSGPKDLALPTSSVRKIEPLPSDDPARSRWRVTLTRGPGDAVKPDERAAALAPDATMDSSHPAIVAQAKALAADARDPAAKVRAVAEWVYRTLDKKLATHLPMASTVLDKKVGDCTEHTWLTVALARALGIPARPLYGIAYLGDGEPVFGYHAWTEVALPGPDGVERWLAIDSTWGEPEADATHIVLGTGFGEVAASIGGLTIDKARKP